MNSKYDVRRAFYSAATAEGYRTHQPSYDALKVSLEGKMCNDNQLMRIIFSLGQKLGSLPNDLDVDNHKDWPDAVRAVLDSLHREIPSAPFHPGLSDDDILSSIRSRYMQFGGEIDVVVDDIFNEIDSYKNSVSVPPKKPETPDESSSE